MTAIGSHSFLSAKQATLQPAETEHTETMFFVSLTLSLWLFANCKLPPSIYQTALQQPSNDCQNKLKLKLKLERARQRQEKFD